MDRNIKLALEHAKLQAQYHADNEDKPMNVIGIGNTYATMRTEDCTDEPVFHTAYPSIYEELTPNAGALYNRDQVRFTSIRKIHDDDNTEATMETTTAVWSIEYAKCVRDFLNKVLQSEEK